jgi:FtsP/CotA-like multicopper oxidase with cupredoxin domain
MKGSLTMNISTTARRLITVSIFCLVGLLVAFSYIEPNFASTGRASTSVISLQAPVPLKGPGVPAALNMGMPTGVPLTTLQAPHTAAHVKHFTLTAQPALIKLGSGGAIRGWGFNGVVPGPTLHVQQGDLVEVTLVNHLSLYPFMER